MTNAYSPTYTDDINLERAREIAGYWHTGQWSALYAFASTGKTSFPTEVLYEIRDAILFAQGHKEDQDMLLDLMLFIKRNAESIAHIL